MTKPIHTIIAALLLPTILGDKLLATPKKEEISIPYQEIHNYYSSSENTKMFEQNIKIKSRLLYSKKLPGGNSTAISPNDQFLATIDEKMIKLWQLDSGKLVWNFDHQYKVDIFHQELSFSSDSQTILASHDDSIIQPHFWRVSDGKFLGNISADKYPGTLIAVMPSKNAVISLGSNNNLDLWQLNNQAITTDVTEPNIWSINRRHIIIDNKFVFSYGYQKINIWNIGTGKEVNIINIDNDWPGDAITVSPDRKTILCGDWTGEIHIIRNNKKVKSIFAHTPTRKNGVNALMFRPDGKTFISAGSDGLIKVWRSSDGGLLHTIKTRITSIQSAALSTDGNTIAATGWGDRLEVWRLSPF
jgi:WD40 repeat protein